MIPKVVIVGRPNVGKSTLFNRLVGRRMALVDDQPGVTRDRREGHGKLGNLNFTLVDTAGLEEAAPQSLAGRMLAQTKAAIADADAILFVIDARAGLLPADRGFADLVRKSGKRAILIANKSEGKAGEAGALEAYALGLGEPVAISAEHGEGLADLYDALQSVCDGLQSSEEADDREPDGETRPARPIRVAVVGRPNAGKSTLVNRLLGEERLLTGPEAGITRDTISVPLTWQGHHFLFHDTAGMRRKSRIEEKVEKLAVSDALEAIRFADVVIVLMDAAHPFEEQDLRIADLVEREDAVRPVAPFAGSINDGSLDRLDACDPALDVKPVGGNQGGSHHAPAQKVKPALRVRGKRTLHVDEKGTMLLKVDDEKVGRVGRPVVNFRAQPDASQCIPVVAHQHLEGSGHDWEGRLGRHDAKRWMLGSKPGHSLLEQPALVISHCPDQ